VRRWQASARSVRLSVAALLLSLTGLSCGAGQLESPADETIVESVLGSAEKIVEPPAPSQTPNPLWGGDLRTRSQFTGDWGGSRDALATKGLTFFSDITQYYQGVASGGLKQQFRYGGRADYLIDLDSQKMGLWKGGHIDLRAETRLGQDSNEVDGAVAPSNFAMALPLLDQDVTALTGVQYTQDFSEHLSVFCGKLNLLDGTPSSYIRAARLNYFSNAAMQSNLSRSYLFPSTLGMGFTIRDDDEPVFNFYLLDTYYTPTTSGFSTLFANGVLLYGEYRLRTNWFGLPGHSSFGFLWSNASRTSLDGNPYLLLSRILAGLSAPTEDLSWSVLYHFDQVVYADGENPARNWILRGDYGLTDGDPNPIQWFANVSLIGNSPIQNRENDSIGIGYYHIGVSNFPLFAIHRIGDENGVEVFYNAAIRPWFHVTSDLQVLTPAQQSTPTAILVGLRARLSF
jgi:porin